MSLAPPPVDAWRDMPSVWRRWFQALFDRVGGAVVGGSTETTLPAYVLNQAASATPAMDGTATAGASTRYARADHVHPTDTSRAPLASPALTGTPTAPTPAAGDNSTKIATTAFLVAALPRATVDVTAGAPGTVAIVGTAAGISGVAIVAAGAPVSTNAVKFTFSTAMPDTNYVALAVREILAGDSAAAIATGYQVFEKTTTDFTMAFNRTNANAYGAIDQYTHRFSVLVYR